MPTYDYRCEKCEHEFELFQQMSDSVKRKCPACGELKLRRLIGTGAGVLFKGSGFYETDYRSDSYRKAAEAETKAASGKTDGKTDGKAGKTKKGDAKAAGSSSGEKPKKTGGDKKPSS